MLSYERPTLKRSAGELLLYIRYAEKERAKVVGSYRWDPERVCWVYPATKRIYDALVAEFGDQLDIQFDAKPTANTALSQTDDHQNARLLQLADEVERLRKENDGYKEHGPVLFDQVRQLSADNASLKNEKNRLAQQRDELRGELDRVRAQPSSGPSIDSLMSQLRQREAHLAQVEDQLDKRDMMLTDQKALADGLRRKCVDWEAKYTDLYAKAASLRARNGSLKADTSVQTRIMYVALEATRHNAAFAALLDQAELDDALPIRIARSLETKLRTMLKIPESERPQLNDLLYQAGDSGIMTRDAVDLAHIIRKQRNIIAHSENEESICQARSIICLFAAALLWPEFDED